MLKKFIESIKVEDYEVLTDDGFVDILAIHKTIPYEVFELKTKGGYSLKCADTHIVFNEYLKNVFVKDLKKDDYIAIRYKDTNLPRIIEVEEVCSLGFSDNMFDLELPRESNHRYFADNVLSHNTFMAQTLADFMFGSADDMIYISCSEYSDNFSVSKLFGAPPGYIGYDKGGQLTEKVRRKPYSLILFDEIEKASDAVFDALLQVFDKGVMQDGIGRDINFKNCIICCAGNVGSKEISQFGTGLGFDVKNDNDTDNERNKSIVTKAIKKKFKPEFINRFDDIIVFNNLTSEDIFVIAENELNKLSERLKESGYKNIKFDKSLIEFIASVGFDKEYGARPLLRQIQVHVEDLLSDYFLDDMANKESSMRLCYDKKSDKVVIKNK